MTPNRVAGRGTGRYRPATRRFVATTVVAVAAGLVLLGACTTGEPGRRGSPTRLGRAAATPARGQPLPLLATHVEATRRDAQHLKNGNVGLPTTLANDGTSAEGRRSRSAPYTRQVVYRVGEGAGGAGATLAGSSHA